MIPFLVAAFAATAQPTPTRPDFVVTHPQVACWTGERTWTPLGEPPSQSMSFRTYSDVAPERIEHNRDEFFDRRGLVEAYSFIDYHFANDGEPLLARTYLNDDPTAVEVRFRREVPPADSEEARRMISAEVLCYLQKRFQSIDALTRQGYEQLWIRE